MDKNILVKCSQCGNIFKREKIYKINKFNIINEFLCSKKCMDQYRIKNIKKCCR